MDELINKIHLADCYEFIKKIPDKSIDCVYIDIPYEIQKGGTPNEFAKKIRKIVKGIEDGIDYSIFDELKRVMKKTNIFIWCNKQQIKSIINIFEQYSMEILTWNKSNPTPMTNNVWLSDIEYCLYFREKGVPLNDGYEYKSKWYISPINKSDKDLFDHPTIKPLDLVKRHLLHTTKENDIVFDCFVGSGTTCVAAEEINRRFIGVEIDTKYHKIACDRLNGITAYGQTSIFTNFENIGATGSPTSDIRLKDVACNLYEESE